MPININNQVNNALNNYGKAAANKVNDNNLAANNSAKSDSVTFTSQAQQLNNVQAKMLATPEVDLAKVAQIKQAISEGRYSVNPEKLAQSISQFEQQLQPNTEE
ncbi:flagellar biosynthesis anti-sigma factor FlgM [Shewanella marina]|uniref:flagellar biosynthesis anti-sigma factor FlgM n=1 Tax=Shewanella marina TaxID=487319 RepID=UPI00046E54AC|nr:flagellar biosynthesis anti-sigma factor FlgM [Shewanella marina]